MHQKKEFKNDVKGFGLEELRKRLEELKTEKMRQEMKARGFAGDLEIPMSKNRMANTHEAYVNLKKVRHQIAFIIQTIRENENEKRQDKTSKL